MKNVAFLAVKRSLASSSVYGSRRMGPIYLMIGIPSYSTPAIDGMHWTWILRHIIFTLCWYQAMMVDSYRLQYLKFIQYYFKSYCTICIPVLVLSYWYYHLPIRKKGWWYLVVIFHLLLLFLERSRRSCPLSRAPAWPSLCFLVSILMTFLIYYYNWILGKCEGLGFIFTDS